jgi:phosphomevalonate kinase
MKARAPGKLVISGAYAVLEGAPAIVTAVDRYVIADATARASFVTPEVQAALGAEAAPAFDAAALREGDAKLGLGSSAAILVASLAARTLLLEGQLSDEALRESIFERALAAHARAQDGGSGIDVAASTYGGSLIAVRQGRELAVGSVRLPAALHVSAWFSGEAASTRALLSRVHDWSARDAAGYRSTIGAQMRASERAAQAFRDADAPECVEALDAQYHALLELGRAAAVGIVTEAVTKLREVARRQGATVLPSGAGGGDIALYVGLGPPSRPWTEQAGKLGHRALRLALEARGVHAC